MVLPGATGTDLGRGVSLIFFIYGTMLFVPFIARYADELRRRERRLAADVRS